MTRKNKSNRPTNKQRQAVWDRDKYVCQYCGFDGLDSFTNFWSMHVDHLIPSRGNTMDNLVTACVICNSLKGKHIPSINIQSKEKLIEYFKTYLEIKRNTSKEIFLQKRFSLGYKQVVD